MIPYEIHFVGKERQIVSWDGIPINCEILPKDEVDIDTFVIPGGGAKAIVNDPVQIDWIANRVKKARRIVSVCGGLVGLAAAGVVEGKRVVTHRDVTPFVRSQFPTVQLEDEPIFVNDGNIWSSAGAAAGIDLCLSLIEDDLGHEAAMNVAQKLVLFVRRAGGQGQESPALGVHSKASLFSPLQEWVYKNMSTKFELPDLAKALNMSVRTLTRRCSAELGKTPMATVDDIRFEAACRLLEQGEVIATVVRRCGFGSEETLRRTFNVRQGVSPRAYRERMFLNP